jgi:hypothetical protein
MDPVWGDAVEKAVKRASQELAEEMDFSVLADLFKQIGWVEVDFDPHVESILAYEIQHWMRDNCKGQYKSRGRRFLFEREQDAAWFQIRWLS